MSETNQNGAMVKFYRGNNIPLELHKVRVVQKLHLNPIEDRLRALREAGFNSFLLKTKDTFLDMLTDSGCNAMSDRQTAAMMIADDAYAGSQSYDRMEAKVLELFGKQFILPVHQGRAAENIISRAFIQPGDHIPMNYHFTTTKAHIELNGGTIHEIYTDEALKIKSDHPFKGNMDIEKLKTVINEFGAEGIPFIRLEASTNLIGGQPFSMKNMRQVREVANKAGIMIVLDASLIGENAWFIKQRESEYHHKGMGAIIREMSDLSDLVYFSARKLSSSRGGIICTAREDLYDQMRDMVPLFEGFLTYGGMSVREIEAMAVGLEETLDNHMICQSPSFIDYFVRKVDGLGIPVVTPGGALGAHIDAGSFLSHIPQTQYPAGALVSAFYLISGIRGMERGTVSSVRLDDGSDLPADIELMRLAFPRRVFTLSQIEYAIDRLCWLYENRQLVGGLEWEKEPKVLRFFVGRLKPIGDWPERLMAKFRSDFGESL
ncbi:MAG: tryptophanase [Sphaerochaeta sp.]|jgi:tryptophanase|nr:tryptophanase [Sphaerochaeta sp.]PKL29241.1 MAG: tryptophanase [Spirochaetae bacterium HGW-Spirochaetae-2]